jgi:adenylate cyclase
MPMKVLVVDDEPDMEMLCRQRFRRRIRANEIELMFAQNGHDALRVLQEHPEIEVVLTDINMPKMDGLTLLGHLREMNGILRTVVVSAYGDMQNIRTAMNRGAFDFVTKPIDFSDLEATLEKTMELVRTLKQGQAAQRESERLQERNKFIRDTFGRYVSDAVVDHLLYSPRGTRLGGERRKVTTLMCDIRGFTRLSENAEPEEVVDILNRYFEVAMDVILKHQGTVNEILGDGILCFFGAPITRDDDAIRAAAAALELQLACVKLNETNRAENLPTIEIGIGIHTGPTVVGNVGSPKRMKYCAVGQHVNLACRVESFAVGGQILVTGDTLAELGALAIIGQTQEVQAKGVRGPTTIHELNGLGGAFDLHLPRRNVALVELKTPLDVRFSLVDDKQVGRQVWPGTIVALGPRTAEIHSPHCPAPLTDVKLWVVDESGRDVSGDIYAKTRAVAELADDRLVLWFTSQDAAATTLFAELLTKPESVGEA